MRITNDWNEHHKTLCFVDDLPNGGCLVECPCGEQFNTNEYDDFCPKCKQECIYPGWASW